MNFSPRSEYFKTELTTFVGSNSKSKEVKEYSYDVLNTAIDFMYGIEIPDTLNNSDDLKSLLHLADLFLMEDLKKAASLFMAKGLNIQNVVDLCQLAEKFRAGALKDQCVQFLFDNASSIEDDKLTQLRDVTVWVPLVKKFASESKKGNSLLARIFGENPDFDFKTREDFGSDTDYEGYMMSRVKPGMFVRSLQGTPAGLSWYGTEAGAVRMVQELEKDNSVTVVDETGYQKSVPIKYLEIVSPPANF